MYVCQQQLVMDSVMFLKTALPGCSAAAESRFYPTNILSKQLKAA